MTPESADKYVRRIVAAYMSFNQLPMNEIPGVIEVVHHSVRSLRAKKMCHRVVPAVAVKKSVRADHLVCLEDGAQVKSLARHLKSAHRITPEEYRKKWGLSNDYPMVAANFSKLRSDLAKKTGLGTKRRREEAKRASARATKL